MANAAGRRVTRAASGNYVSRGLRRLRLLHGAESPFAMTATTLRHRLRGPFISPEALAEVEEVAVDAVEGGDVGKLAPALEAVAFKEGDAGVVVAKDEGDESAEAESGGGG